MNLPHLHILLNHFPTVGFSVGVALFVVALLGKSYELKRASLAIICLLAVMATAVYTSGNSAAMTICSGEPAKCLPGVEMSTIVAHEDAALLAYMLMQVTGAFAFIGLWQMRRSSRLGGLMAGSVLILSVATFGLMARAATMGGEIRHSEIVETAAASAPEAGAEAPAKTVPAGETPAPAEEKPASKPAQPSSRFEIEWLKAENIKNFVVRDHSWVWPACETLHFIGLSLLFGVVLIVDLRMLGMAKSLSFAAVHRLLPWALVGFGVNLVTGMAFFIAAPQQYATNPMFFWKIVCILLAGVNAMYFSLFDQVWLVKSGDDAPLGSKLAAVSAIALWVGVLFCGHMLPFLGNAF